MRKNYGKQTWMFPMPVLIVGTYDKNNISNAMNAAWGGVYDTNQVMLCLSPEHKTALNIKEKKAFTLNFADAPHVTEADYVGLVSANDEKSKMDIANFHTTKSEFVDAPIIDELPMALECNLIKINEDGIVVGEIVNVSAKESVLDPEGKIDTDKLQIISYDGVHHTYRVLGKVVGKAFSEGKKLK